MLYICLPALHRPAFTTSWVVQSEGWLPRVLFIPYRIHIYVFRMLFGNVLGYIHIVSGGWVYQPVVGGGYQRFLRLISLRGATV